MTFGIKLWRAGAALEAESPGRTLARPWPVTALNHKSLIFFVAFLPRLLEATVVALGAAPLGARAA